MRNLAIALLVCLAACKTPSNHRESSSLAASSADRKSPVRNGFRCAEKQGSWNLFKIETEQAWGAHWDRATCESILSTLGTGGYCTTAFGAGDLSLILPGIASRNWSNSGPLAVDQTVAMAECLKAANPEDPDAFGTEGIRCVANPNGQVMPTTSSGRIIVTEFGSRKECAKVAIEAKYGRVCARNPQDRDFPVGLFDLGTLGMITKFRSELDCSDALKNSAPKGACVAITDDTVFLYARPENGEGEERIWGTHGRKKINDLLNECQEFAMSGYEFRAKPATNQVAQSPHQKPDEASREIRGIVSRNPAFRPGTAILELAIRAGEEEIVVQIGTETNVKLDSQSDLTQLVGTTVVVTGKRESGVLIASSITEQR